MQKQNRMNQDINIQFGASESRVSSDSLQLKVPVGFLWKILYWMSRKRNEKHQYIFQHTLVADVTMKSLVILLTITGTTSILSMALEFSENRYIGAKHNRERYTYHPRQLLLKVRICAILSRHIQIRCNALKRS